MELFGRKNECRKIGTKINTARFFKFACPKKILECNKELSHLGTRELKVFLVCLAEPLPLEVISLPPSVRLRCSGFEPTAKGWLVLASILQNPGVVSTQK